MRKVNVLEFITLDGVIQAGGGPDEDTSGGFAYGGWQAPYSDHALDLFSSNRVMAASNWPVILLGASYEETWNGVTDLLTGLSADERHAVLGGSAKRIYGLS